MGGHNTVREAMSSEYVTTIVFDVIDRVIVCCNTHSECDIMQSRLDIIYTACDVVNIVHLIS